MAITLELQVVSEEEALRKLLFFLRSGGTHSDPMSSPTFGNDIYLPELLQRILNEQRDEHRARSPQGMVSYQTNTQKNSEPYYRAAWSLVNRGILCPAPVFPAPNGHPMTQVAGAGFNITDYGRRWLTQSADTECFPSEYGRFGQLLSVHSKRLGSGFLSRSQEALACYQARAYLACCAMCGAAAESILLSLAIRRNGNEQDVLNEYRKTKGRSRIEGMVLMKQNSYVVRELPNFTALLNYWRDESAHGGDSVLSEEEAFTSLILLLRFAQFADQRWDQLTAPPRDPNVSLTMGSENSC